MRLLLLTNVYPNPMQPTRGIFNFEMAKAFRCAGHEIEVVSPVSWLEQWQQARQGRRLAANRQASLGGVPAYYPPYYYPPKILRPWYGQCMWHSVRRTVMPLVRQSPPDVVISYWTHPDGYVGWQIARQISKPFVAMVGGSDVLMLCRNPLQRRCVAKVLRAADLVLAVSEDIQAKIAALGVPTDKVHVGYRGVDTQHFYPGDRQAARALLELPQQRRLLLCVASLVPVKGHFHLLDACKRLQEHGLDFELLLVGRGPLEAHLRKRCTTLGLDKQVRFVGPVPHDDLPHWYRAAEVTVLASLSEGVPNVLLESMSCGVPFVASKVGGIPEIATEGLDRLVPAGDTAAMAEAIADALETPPSSIQRSFRPGSWADTVEHAVGLFKRVADERACVKEQCA